MPQKLDDQQRSSPFKRRGSTGEAPNQTCIFMPEFNGLFVQGTDKLSAEIAHTKSIPEQDRVMYCWPN